MAETKQNQCELGPWKLSTNQGAILKSECKVSGEADHVSDKCPECCFYSKLKFPLPEMLFGENRLRLAHEDGFALEFNALGCPKIGG